MNLEQFRSAFSITEHRSYLFSGAIAPASDRAKAALQRWTQLWEARPLMNYDAALEEIAALRSAIGDLFGIAPTRVALTENTSRASNIAVRLVSCPPGANVVFDETTYPSSRYPWLRLTSAIPRVASRQEGESHSGAVSRSIDDDTVAVCISHVAPLTGVRHDLRQVSDAARRHKAVLIVDVAQTAGAVPIDLDQEGVDVAVGTTMKWLLGAPGIGFLCVRPGLLEDVGQLDVGYMALDVEGEAWPQETLPRVWSDSRRFELGMPSLPVLAPATAGVELLLAIGMEAVEQQIGILTAHCMAGLADLGIPVRTPSEPEARAGVIAFEHPQAAELAADLADDGVDIGGYDYGLGRVDPHAFNTLEDIDRFLTLMRKWAS